MPPLARIVATVVTLALISYSIAIITGTLMVMLK